VKFNPAEDNLTQIEILEEEMEDIENILNSHLPD